MNLRLTSLQRPGPVTGAVDETFCFAQGTIFGGCVLVGIVQWQAYSPYFGDAVARMQVKAGNVRVPLTESTALAPLLPLHASDVRDDSAQPSLAGSPNLHRFPAGTKLYAPDSQGLALVPISVV